MNYLKEFIIGTTGIVTIMFYILYFNIPNKIKTVPNETYVLLVPLYFGMMNVLLFYTKNILLTSFMSATLVFFIVYFKKIYNINGVEWVWYYILLFGLHYVAYNILNMTNIIFRCDCKMGSTIDRRNIR